MCGNKFSISKQHFSLDNNALNEGYMSAIYSLTRKERSHDTENHCGYLIIMDLAKLTFVNTVLRQNLAETKVLTLRLDLSPRPG